MTDSCNITFEPEGKSISVLPGTTLLAAATQAGVFVNGICGGDGVCGRCRVIVKEGKVRGGSTELFTHEEIQAGYILACEGRVETDVVVEIPPESQLAEAPAYADGEVPELPDVSRAARGRLRLHPLVNKVHLHLPPPDLDNNISDLQRLEHALAKETGADGFQMGLKVTRRMPDVMRHGDWQVTAVTAFRGPLTEIVDVEAGDTSQRNMCIAADIGTTTVVCHLVDLRDGQTLGQAAKYNSQATFGADVIRRIIHASENYEKETALQAAIVDDLNELIHELIVRYRLGAQDISLLSASGNTAMLHL
ncbi:MAG: 2Fe-2S iron-sulfur cluster-binding protein, partial [Planctomycetota bacterium]